MSQNKINFGIDLGTTNSALCKFDTGKTLIIKSLDTQKDTTPSCVGFNRKGVMLVGDPAFSFYRSDSLSSRKKGTALNAFVEFKRTMGIDNNYACPNIDKTYSSEELSAEVLKKLKSYYSEGNINAAIVTVPAAFTMNQLDATRRAAKLSGFTQVELLQEPIAAAMAYGLDTSQKDGFWLVFDFGGGTFDAALIKVDEGIIKVIDTEGDNFLGGKNLDHAIINNILFPHIAENFEIAEILNNTDKRESYSTAYKFIAEEIKNNLSFNDSYDKYVDPGDAGFDDDGEEIEIDITVTQSQLAEVLRPIYQKAIDCCIDLLTRNNLSGSDLASLILVGGPTLSPIVREMLSRQITTPDVSVDPMTVVARGAALFGGTIDLNDEIIEESRDRSKIQLQLDFESSTVEIDEFITVKTLPEKSNGDLPEQIFIEILRGDGGWSSGKTEINDIGEVIDVFLEENVANNFSISLYDGLGNQHEVEPSSFTIIQGSKVGSATLPHNIGLEIQRREDGKPIFEPVKGLIKNQSLPATGVMNGLKTQKNIRPGMKDDFIKIPIYEGEHAAEGSRAIYNHHVYDIIISGADLPSLLPENSEVNVTLRIDRSREMTVEAYFPYLDHTSEIMVPTDNLKLIESDWLANELRKASGAASSLDENIELKEQISDLHEKFKNNPKDADSNHEVLTHLKTALKKIDTINERKEWPELEKELKDLFYRLENANNELGNESSTQIVQEFKSHLEDVLRKKDPKLARHLLEEMNDAFMQLTFIYQLAGFIDGCDKHFNSYQWKDVSRARSLVDNGMSLLHGNPSIDELHPIVRSLVELLPREQKPAGDDSILIG